MGWIDGKGRLFGKINVVDFLIIMLLFVIVPFFFHIYSILGKMPTRVPYKWIKVEAVTFTMPEFAELFKEGDISCDENGRPDGKLVRLLKKESRYSNVLREVYVVKYGEIFSKEYMIPVFLEFELSCAQSAKNEPWYYRRQPLFASIDDKFVFVTDKYRIVCSTLKIEGEKR